MWVEDRDWRVPQVPGVVACSFPRCTGRAVAIMRRYRRAPRGTRGWGLAADYYYCPAHLYGRKVELGHVWVQVHPESPAAERGWTAKYPERHQEVCSG